MKTAILAAVLAATALACPAWAKGGGHSGGSRSYSAPRSYSGSSSTGSHSIQGYTKQNGTYVAPAHATNPNATKNDNWTTRGNVNPYTGAPGTRNPDGG